MTPGDEVPPHPWSNEERLRLALEGAQLGLWDGNHATGEIYWNDQSYRQFGLPIGEAMTYGRFLSLLAPEDRERVEQAWRRAADGREDYRVDFPITWPDGSRHWIRAVGRVYCGPDGQPVRVSGIHIDITVQKEAEREIQALNAGLEARIKARAAELEAEIAERRRLEEELRLFQAIIEAADEAIAISRPDGQLHYINPAHEQLFGFSLAEARARNYRDYYPPASLAILEGEVVPRLARGESWEGELEVQDRGGRRFPLWERAGALCRADGALAFGFGFMHDISARKAAETALARQEAELRKLLAGLPIGVAIVGLPDDGKIQYLNDQFTATFGYTLEDVPTVEAWFVKAYPDGAYRQRVRRLWDEALRRAGKRQGLVETHEYRIRCKDGGSRDTLINAVMLEGRLVATFVDLSAYHQLEKRAQLSEARYRLIAEHSRDLIWTMNLAGEFTYLSPSLESMLGYTPEEYQLLPPSKSFTPESYVRVQEGLAEARARVAAGLPCEFEVELEHLTKDGSCHWSHEIAVAMYDRDGHFIEFMGISRDITQRKLQEEALRQAREAAEAANAAKSRFLATITHELRSPLHAILGFTQVLAEREDEASSAPGAGGSRADRRGRRRRDLLAGIDRNGRHLLALVNDLLELSRLESGHLKLRARPTALRPLLEECLADFSALAAHQGLELYLKFHPGLPVQVLIDPQRLRQILVNLLGNALKYTARGEITLTAGAVPSTTLPGRLALSFSVADTGPGIAPADQELIFNPFGQENGGLTAGKPKGHGLGLAICRQLAALMGGEIRLDSVPGQGSRFTLWLPAVSLTNAGQGQADAAAGGVAARAGTGIGIRNGGELAAPVSPGTPPVRSPASVSLTPAKPTVPSPAPGLPLPPSLGPVQVPATLLVIDDEPDNLSLATEIFQDRGLEIVSAADGATGLRLAATLRPDLILLDIRMPGLDGFQVCERLKADPATRPIPVIFLSALDQFEDKARGFAAGAVDYIAKPCDARELLLRVTNHVRLARLAPGPSAASPEEPPAAGAKLAPDRSLLILLRARDRLLADLANPPDLNALARDCGTNRTSLQHFFRATLGMSVYGYLREQRLQLARALLAEGGHSIDRVAALVGYSQGHNFTRAFKQRFGLVPSQLPHPGEKLPH